MRAYYLTGFAAVAAMGTQLAACGGSDRSFDETGGAGGSSAGTGNASSGGSGNGGSGNGGSGNGGSGNGGSGNGGSGNGGSGGSSAGTSGGNGNGGSTAGSGGTAGNGGSAGSTAGAGGSAAGAGGSAAGAGGSAGASGGNAGTGAASGSGGASGSAGAGGSGGSTTQSVQCDVNNANPANSSDVIADVTITYDTGTMTWSDPAACDWDCNTNYCEDAAQCLSSKKVPCDVDNANPANSKDLDTDVTVTCSGSTFSNPSKCLWACNASYCLDGNSCSTSKTAPCDTTKNPANSSNNTGNVSVSCGAGGVWGAPAACTWKCNSGYVKDASGNACVRPLYLFSAGAASGLLGGRAGADTLCQKARDAKYPKLPKRVHAFISVVERDEIRNMPKAYGYSSNVPILGYSGGKIVDDWTDLLDGSLDASLEKASVTSGYWYSGSNPDGSIEPSMTCDGWKTNKPTVMGVTGDGRTINSDWIKANSVACSSNSELLCLAGD